MIQALHVFVPAAWLVAALLYAHQYGRPVARRVDHMRRAAALAALLLHPALLALQWRDSGIVPAHDAWSTVSCTALLVALLHFLTTRLIDNGGTGAIVLLVVAVMQLFASAFGAREPLEGAPRPSAFYFFHVLTSTTAMSALILSGINGGLYLLSLRRMRQSRFDSFVRGLPSLETLVALTRRSALAGFLLLSVGVNFGIGWAHYAKVKGFHYSDPFVLFILVLWLHFGVVAFSRWIPGLSARRASIAATAGLTLFLSVFLLTLVPEVTFHWSPR